MAVPTVVRNLMALAAALVVFLGMTLAQTPGGGQTTPPGGGTSSPGGGGGNVPGGGAGNIPSPSPGNIPGRSTQPTIPQTPTGQTPFPDIQRPIFLSGKVMMSDGSPVPDGIVIERMCGGNVRPEGYVDSKGRFSFQLGQNMGVFADASTGSFGDPMGSSRMGGGSSMGNTGAMGGTRGVSERDLTNCELRANLAGYRSDVVQLAGRRFMDNPEVGTIILHRLANVEGLTISATTAMAPKDAKKAFDKGREAAKKNKTAEAVKDFEKAVELYPRYAVAWYNLGLVKEQQKDGESARKAYQQALAADSRYVNPYMQLAQISAAENKWQDVADTTDRVLKLNPYDFPRAYFLNAAANFNLKKYDAAERSAREALKNDASNQVPRIHHLLGLVLAQKRDYAGAIPEIQAYLKAVPFAADADTVKKQLTELQRLSGTSDSAEKKQ
jgi:tetratricopeptide (TPR) repeat protein